jgi:threonine-phosphate decarboxylase
VSDHGGNIYEAARRTGIPVEKILDFSASINPLGVPKEAARIMKRAVSRLYHYPEPYAEGLVARIADSVGVDRKSIICGNGSTELIYLIPRVLRPYKALIPEPSFREYERACRTAGTRHVVGYRLRSEDDFDLPPDTFVDAMSVLTVEETGIRPPCPACTAAFLCNPNNPTGRLVPKEDVLKIARAAAESTCYLIVDEAFIDFCPEESVSRYVADNPFLIVLRSLTKFYALSGLRIGYGIFHPAVASRMQAHKEPWTVNSLAQAAGLAVLNDEPYQRESMDVMAREKAFLEAGLKELEIPFTSSRANYYLLHTRKAQGIREALEEKGILVRDCSNFTGLDDNYLRVAVRSRKENKLLLREMGSICARLS